MRTLLLCEGPWDQATTRAVTDRVSTRALVRSATAARLHVVWEIAHCLRVPVRQWRCTLRVGSVYADSCCHVWPCRCFYNVGLQAAAHDVLMTRALLSPGEEGLLRWAANSATVSAPPHVTRRQYKKATAVEVLVCLRVARKACP